MEQLEKSKLLTLDNLHRYNNTLTTNLGLEDGTGKFQKNPSETESPESVGVALNDLYHKVQAIIDSESVFITNERFSPVERAAVNAIQIGSLGTINGESIENENSITLDLSLYKIVSELPTENILDNKIYLIKSDRSAEGKDVFNEYVYVTEEGKPGVWELIGQLSSDIDLSGYLKTTDADKKYVAKSTNTTTALNTDKNGALANFSDNGQAYLAIRPKTDKFIISNPYAGAAFGVKDDGTAAFSHKTYTNYNKNDGSYTGAKNTAVLQFAGPTGLRYAKNTGGANDVTSDMYKYVGVIDSPDEFQRVYSAKQVDELLKDYVPLSEYNALAERIEAIEKMISNNDTDVLSI